MLENINTQYHQIEPYVLVDEVSNNEVYIGTSNSFNDKSKPIWRIKQIIKVGTVWVFRYPEGNQDFKFVWEDRLTLNYK